MLRGLLLMVGVSGCGLYFAEDGPSDGADHPSGDGATSTSPDCDFSTAVSLPPGPPPACTPVLPSDRWIVFDSDRDLFNRDVYVMRADGAGLCRLTLETSIDKEPAPSFDGSKIAFASNRTGAFQIHVIDLTSNIVTQLTTHGGEEPAFSHDGTRVAFRRGTAVYTIRINGTDEMLIADSGINLLNAYANPQFSIDDTELYFDRNNELDAIRLDGSGLRYIVNNWTTNIKAPAVAANGLAVAYETYCGQFGPEGDSIWLTSPQTASNPCIGRRATASDPTQHAHRPAFGPDNIIAFEQIDIASGVAALALVDTAPNSQVCPITTDPFDHRNPAWLIRHEP